MRALDDKHRLTGWALLVAAAVSLGLWIIGIRFGTWLVTRTFTALS